MTEKLPTGIVEGFSFDEYKADPGLNASTLKRFRRTVREGAFFMSKEDEPPKHQQILGTAQHTKMEDPETFDRLAVEVRGLSPKAYPETFQKRTEERHKEDAENGREPSIVLAEGWLERIEKMTEAAFAHPRAGELLRRPAQREVCLFWDDPDMGVRCKARIDRLADTGIDDIKTTSDADPDQLCRDMLKFGYDMSAAWYLRGLSIVRGDLWPEFRLIFIESDEPYHVVVGRLGDAEIQAGAVKCVDAVGRWKRWRAGDLTGYSDGEVDMYLPPWGRTERKTTFTWIGGGNG